MQQALLIKSDETETPIAPANGETFTLDEMQGYVGGFIEIHMLGDGRWIVINEEGIFLDLPPNPTATIMAPHLVTGDTGILGDVIVCPRSMIA